MPNKLKINKGFVFPDGSVQETSQGNPQLIDNLSQLNGINLVDFDPDLEYGDATGQRFKLKPAYRSVSSRASMTFSLSTVATYFDSTTASPTTSPTTSGTSIATITVGQAGSGADYICDGTDDNVQIQQAIDFAAATGNRKTVEIIGYGADFQYQISAPVILKASVSIIGTGYGASTCLWQQKAGVSDDMLRTDNFYNDIDSNYNSYSTIGKILIEGITFVGNGVRKTTTYPNLAGFPTTGQVVNNIYVARDTDIGYFWNGSAYTVTGIKRAGLHWRAYANHLVKIYAFQYFARDLFLVNAGDFCFYSEQTNTDTNIFNNYETMEATLFSIRFVGYNLGGINWMGPHDSAWYDVKGHTNEFATDALYNIYLESTANSNGGGLIWHDVHPWGPTASYGSNVVSKNCSVRGSCYVEAGSASSFYGEGSSFPGLHITVTNSKGAEIILKNCTKVKLDVEVGYLFNPLKTIVKLIGVMDRVVIDVPLIDTTTIAPGAKLFDITELTGSNLVKLSALLPYTTPQIAPGILATDLSINSQIDVMVADSTFGSGSKISKN